MTVSSVNRGGRIAKIFLATLIVICSAIHSVPGARCRFASTSASQGSCIFPCRCTDGCNTTTGDCINGGQCVDDHPSGYRWSGTACQSGNVAYHKTASQSANPNKDWSRQFPAERAVDGDTNPDMHQGHCAHPDTVWGQNAWWVVDLGGTYNIYKVIIYNRGDSRPERLNRFILSVGNSSDRATHTACSRHHGRVAAGATVNKSCTAVARYLSFRRDGGVDSYITGLCEVIVIGHKYISCQHCPSTSACNDVIGCAVCAPGKQQPDCVKACDSGTYEKNCEEDCGHCKDIQQCNVTNGHCTTGCETWYTSDVCKANIRSPYYKTSDRPTVEDVTNSSVVVSWPKAKNIPTGLEIHYYYIVWLQTGEGTFINVSRVPQVTDLDRLQSRITGLTFNTNYSVKLEPYRKYNERRQSGTSIGVTRFKTSCKAPDTPTIEKVTTAITKGCALASVFVIWEVLRYTGCDELVAVGGLYRRQASTNGQWSYKKVERVTSRDLAITDLAPEMYEVKVTATNNEGLTSISDSITVNLLTTSSSQTTEKTAPVAAGLGTGPVIGIAVSTFVLGGLVTAVIFINVMRMRLNKSNADTEEEQREQPSIELGGDVAVEEQGRVVPPRTPGEQEDVTQDENEYEPTTAVPRQQEYVNVNIYDVIQN